MPLETLEVHQSPRGLGIQEVAGGLQVDGARCTSQSEEHEWRHKGRYIVFKGEEEAVQKKQR